MPLSDKVKIPYPAENKPNWYSDFVSMINAIDGLAYGSREDRNLSISGGGTVSFAISGDTGVLTWSDHIDIFSPSTGFYCEIPANTLLLSDGDIVYVNLTRAPTSNTNLSIFQATNLQESTFPDDAYVVAYRKDTLVYFHDGYIIGDGETGPLLSETTLGSAALSDLPPNTIDAGDTADPGIGGSASRYDHTHAVNTALAGDLVAVDASAAGAGTSIKIPRADHKHTISTGTPGTITFTGAAAGSAITVAKSDHTHAMSSGTPSNTGTANSEGSSANPARVDHVHKTIYTAKSNGSTTGSRGAFNYSTNFSLTDNPGSDRVDIDLSSSPSVSNLTISSMTQGSVLFAGSGGLVSQDNATLNFNDATNTLTVAGTLTQNTGAFSVTATHATLTSGTNTLIGSIADKINPVHLAIAAQAVGDLLYADSNTTFTRLPDVASGSYLRSGGLTTAPVWSTTTLPNSATTGDILYASGSNTYSNLADVAVGSYLRSGGVTTAPVWSTVTLPNSATTGDLIYASGANTYSNLADVATGRVLVSGGVGVAPSYSTTPTVTGITLSGLTQNSVLFAGSGGAVSQNNSVFTYNDSTTTLTIAGSFTQTTGAVSITSTHTTLVSGSNTLIGSIADKLNAAQLAIASQAVGDILYADSGSTFTRLADVAAGSYLRSGGVTTAPVWSTTTLPNSATTGDIIYASSANTYSNLADVAAGSYLRSGGVTTAPVWSTTTLPNSATTGDLIYASGSNVYSNLADVATGQVLISGGVGVAPSYSATPSLTDLTLSGTLYTKQGANIASSATLTLTGGNSYFITGTTTIKGIVTTGIQDGTVITLSFNDACTVTNASASPGTNAKKFILRGGVDYSSIGVPNNIPDSLTLILETRNSVEAWYEIARSSHNMPGMALIPNSFGTYLTMGGVSYNSAGVADSGGVYAFSSMLGRSLTQQVENSISPVAAETITGGAHTNLTAGVEYSDVVWNFARTVQHATGAITTNRTVQISAPTFSFVGASTITNAATVAITAAPTAGTNATITNKYAFWVQADDARFDGNVFIQAGTSAVLSKAHGNLHVDTSAVGNVGAGEDTLITYSLAGATLATNNDSLEIEAWGTTAANGNNKNIKLYFGSTIIFATGAVAFNNKDWFLKARVTRTGATTQIAIATFNGDTTLVTTSATYTTPSETLSGAITIKCTGEATADNDIVQKGQLIKWCPAN